AGAAADELARRHPEVRVVHNPNQGAGPAREAGRLLARGEFIQYLDSDDLLLPRKFEIQVEALRRRPECGAAYGFIRLDYGDGRVLDKPYKGSGDEMPFLFPRLLIERWWNTDCPLFRRSVCDAVGPWTNLRYSQDWEYDGRVGALKTRLVHCKEYVTVQRQHGGPRQTGHGKWLKPCDRVRFFRLLVQHARAAGMSREAPEWDFFSKWVFLNARQSAAMGDPRAAEDLYQLACETSDRPGTKMRLIGAAARVLGWRATGKLCAWHDRVADAVRRRR
ncbi:MAG TPA: glycosyltransferase family A protein, partial [Candidatus Brocadiia bacterium]|nr:glycosyltransferase family A protein [Candidatus Brocadiia bacterium]